MSKNEAKYEECIDIMDEYEKQMIQVFTEAHGKLDLHLFSLTAMNIDQHGFGVVTMFSSCRL